MKNSLILAALSAFAAPFMQPSQARRKGKGYPVPEAVAKDVHFSRGPGRKKKGNRK